MLVPAHDNSLHAVRRRLAAALRTSTLLATGAPLETLRRGQDESPTLRAAELIEGKTLRARAVKTESGPRFSAFLDGAQRSIAFHWDRGVPVVHGTVGAAIRVRRERRLVTWASPIVRHMVLAPMSLLPAATRTELETIGVEIVDTLALREPESSHPFALQEIAYQAVMSARERAEQELARQWCAGEQSELLIDGGISGSDEVATSGIVVGGVKSHQTLHARAEDVATIMGLEAGQRTSVVRIESPRRAPVASWYLRLREHSGHDPFWGLVRVEASLADTAARAWTQRADDVSSWILAERLPLAVPDARWDKMVYGIRDSEEYLRAVQ